MSVIEFIESAFMNAPDVSDSIPDNILNPPNVVSLCDTCSNNMQLVHYFPDLSLSNYIDDILPSLRQRITDYTFWQGKNRENVLDDRLKKLNSVIISDKFSLL